MGEGLRVLVTGGTLDKVHDPIKEEFVFGGTHLPEMLKLGRNTSPVEVETLMLIDSLDMTEEHRNKILEKCRKSPEERLIITHGTSTMVETARLLGQNIKDKTIVLTGAMVPHVIRNSDAVFNFAYAFGAAMALPKGVYVAMNCKILPWNNVRKNAELGRFETLG